MLVDEEITRAGPLEDRRHLKNIQKNLVFNSIWINFSRSEMKFYSHFLRLIEILHYLCSGLRNIY